MKEQKAMEITSVVWYSTIGTQRKGKCARRLRKELL